MSEFFVEVDAEREPTLWRANGLYPVALVRRCDLPPLARPVVWPLIERTFR